jgi:hypothetical protein
MEVIIFLWLQFTSPVVPVIVVFTKIDRLRFQEHKRIKRSYITNGMDAKAAAAQAKNDCVAAAAALYDKTCVQVLQSDLVPRAWMKYCAVSNKGSILHF